LEAGTWWDNLLTSAHNWLLRSVETLGRVRRLAWNNPVFQLNIANEGSRQFVVGELRNQLSTHPPLQQLNLF